MALQGTQRGQPLHSISGDSKATGCQVGGGLQECCRRKVSPWQRPVPSHAAQALALQAEVRGMVALRDSSLGGCLPLG